MTSPNSFWDVFEDTARKVLHGDNAPAAEMMRVVDAAKRANRIGIYPCNRYSRKILHYFETNHPELLEKIVAVFDKSDNLNFRKDVPLHKLSDISAFQIDTLIVSTSKFPDDLLPDIDAVSFPRDKVFMTSFFREQLAHMDLEDILGKVRKVVDMMADNKSRTTYLLTWLSLLLLDKDILSVYRQTIDVAYRPDGRIEYHGLTLSHIFEANIQNSLFLEIYRMEHVTPAPGDIVFDIGAYRGDTVAYFRKYLEDTGKIYAFEPDETNYQYLSENIRNNRLSNVIPVKKALFDSARPCNLISTPQSGSFLYVMKEDLDTTDFTKIDAVTLDDFVASENLSRVDFIKSDIEGCELEMLKGARNTIGRFSPKLAIAIYHSVSDLLNIPLLVQELNPNYEFFVRHWNFEGSPWEILMFAKPKSSPAVS